MFSSKATVNQAPNTEGTAVKGGLAGPEVPDQPVTRGPDPKMALAVKINQNHD